MAQADKFTFRKHATIGAAAAEEDRKFLSECFVDNGDLEPLAEGPSTIVADTINLQTSVSVHPMFHRVLGIRPK
jgi:hypothetical protein